MKTEETKVKEYEERKPRGRGETYSHSKTVLNYCESDDESRREKKRGSEMKSKQNQKKKVRQREREREKEGA